MKYVTLSFDDGRKDNLSVASPILRKYDCKATVFCVTGFVDGTWTHSKDIWKSVGDHLTVDDIRQMSTQGWEIGLHGDTHITAPQDWETAVGKLKQWGLFSGKVSFSIPNSNYTRDDLNRIYESDLGNEIDCIRAGRRIRTKDPRNILLYGLYRVFRFQWAYNLFNKPSVNNVRDLARRDVRSVVIKRTDSPQMIERFIDSAADDSWIVFMLHSILPKSDSLYSADSWTWSDESFASLVDYLHDAECKGQLQVIHFNETDHWGKINENQQ